MQVNNNDSSLKTEKNTKKVSADTLYICASILIAALMICYFLREISINVLY